MGNKTNKLALTGGAAAAEALRQINPDVMAVYPITPQTPIIETYAKFGADGLVETEIIQVESEHSAISASVGASAAGARVVTATSSQGLALMNEILYIASGMRLPILMIVAARALSAPLNIHGDHSDVMGARDAGWIQIFCENAQEVYDFTLIGMKLAEKARLPVMVIMDGFNTSHSVENLEILSDEKIRKFLGERQVETSLLNTKGPVTFGPLALQDAYFEFKIDQEEAMKNAQKEFQDIADEFERLSGRKHGYFEEYEMEKAQDILVVLGSASGTVKESIDRLKNKGEKVGLVKLNLFRPFPRKEIANSLKDARNIAVLDRSISSGSNPPLYSEIVGSLFESIGISGRTSSYVYGLGGRDIFQKDIENIFSEISRDKKQKSNYIK